ncbi:hypothetical protein LUZ60_010605 [Juncus effusus]|nr:hypothetical protein LUZ60_010605 [Juncus effusus]
MPNQVFAILESSIGNEMSPLKRFCIIPTHYHLSLPLSLSLSYFHFLSRVMNQVQEGEEQEEENVQLSLTKTITKSIESLIYTSDSIRLFPIKWRSIQNQLDQLNSTLSLLSQQENKELTNLLQSISSTCEETELLADQCRDETYTRGNLFLRSELNSIISKIDSQISELERIYTCSLSTTKSCAIVVSKPGLGASREEIRFFLRDLFARLKVGDVEMRSRAMCMLNEALNEDERYVKLVSTEEEGLSQLINLIEFGDLGVQAEALEAISVIAKHEIYRNTLVIHGIIAPVVKCVDTGTELGKERALKVLNKLTENCNNAWSVSAHGGVTVLLNACDSSINTELIRLACQILKNLSGINEIKDFMLESKAIEILSRLVKRSDGQDEAMHIRVLELLTILSNGEQIFIIGSLLSVLDPVMTRYTSKTREVALKSIEQLYFSSIKSTKKLIDLGFLDRVLHFLRHDEVKMQEIALKSLCNICKISQEARILLGQIGFMSDLIRIIETKSYETCDVAGETLFLMVSIEKNKKKFVQGELNVAWILKLVNCEEEKLRKYLLLILVELSESSLGRRKIGGSEYFKNLELLAQNDVSEATKIVKRIRSGSKFKSILNGIGFRGLNK